MGRVSDDTQQAIYLVGGLIFVAIFVNTWVIVGTIKGGFLDVLDQIKKGPPKG